MPANLLSHSCLPRVNGVKDPKSNRCPKLSIQITCVWPERTPVGLEWDSIEAALYHPVADVLDYPCAISRLNSEHLEALLTCKRGSASVTFNGVPLGCLALQKISADAAARGHTRESRFWGPDCSLHKICSPANQEVSSRIPSRPDQVCLPPRTSSYCVSVKFASGSKVYA